MQTPMSEGGTLEFAQNGYLVNGAFYFSYRHFQVLSNELAQPRLVRCPSDLTREPAANFTVLQNTNLSYFVGISAEYNKPGSILSGDRNVTNNVNNGSIMQNAYGIRWTAELHSFKGNILFADGHVEQVNSLKLEVAQGGNSDLVLPSAPGGSSGSWPAPRQPAPGFGPGGSFGGNFPTPPPSGMPPNQPPQNSPPGSSSTHLQTTATEISSIGTESSLKVEPTNALVPIKPKRPGLIVEEPEAPLSQWLSEKVVKPIETSNWLWLLYLLLLLLLLALIGRVLYRRLRERKLLRKLPR
jgi:prepilin-type processing-associated H-X9-DG protein